MMVYVTKPATLKVASSMVEIAVVKKKRSAHKVPRAKNKHELRNVKFLRVLVSSFLNFYR